MVKSLREHLLTKETPNLLKTKRLKKKRIILVLSRQQKYDKFGIFIGGSCSAKGSLPMCHLDRLA